MTKAIPLFSTRLKSSRNSPYLENMASSCSFGTENGTFLTNNVRDGRSRLILGSATCIVIGYFQSMGILMEVAVCDYQPLKTIYDGGASQNSIKLPYFVMLLQKIVFHIPKSSSDGFVPREL